MVVKYKKFRLELLKICCIKGDTVLFSNLSVEINGGTALQVKGGNGAGKTSLLRIITGVSQPFSGQVLWQSLPIGKQRDFFKGSIFFLGHRDCLKPDLTLQENVNFLLDLNGIVVTEAQLKHDLDFWGLGRAVDILTANLSRGQKKRIGLMFLKYSRCKPLWILDEPLSGLDSEGVERVIDQIDGHLKHGGITIFTSHNQAKVKFPIKTLSVSGK